MGSLIPHRIAMVARGVGLAALCMLTVACGRKAADAPPPEPAPLALVNGVAITEADVAFEATRRQQARRPVGTPESILDDLVQRQVMLQSAEASGMLDEPDARRVIENQKLSTWLDNTLARERDAVTVTDAELRAAYEADIATYTRPSMARLAILYRSFPSRDNAEEAEAVKAALASAVAEFEADREGATRQGRMKGFGAVAAAHSEDTVSRYRGGDIGWIEAGHEGHRLPTEILAAGQALEVGVVSEVIAAGDGYYVVLKSAEQPARVTPFEEVVPALRRRLISTRQDEVEQAFVARLKETARIEINPDKLAALSLPVPEGSSAPDAIAPPGLLPVTEMKPRTAGQ